MRLQPVVAPDALNRRLADSRGLGHRSHRPLRRMGRSLPSGLGNHVGFLQGPYGRSATTARRIPLNPRQPIRNKPIPPSPDRASSTSQLRRDLIVPLPVRARTILALKHQSRRRTPPARPFRQRRSFFRRHCDDLRNPHGMILRGWSIRRQNPQIRFRILETLHQPACLKRRLVVAGFSRRNAYVRSRRDRSARLNFESSLTGCGLGLGLGGG